MRTLPPHAYIPGQTQRHHEAQFDEIISSIPSVIDFETIQTLSAFHTALNYTQHFHWEAHEIRKRLDEYRTEFIERLFTQIFIWQTRTQKHHETQNSNAENYDAGQRFVR